MVATDGLVQLNEAVRERWHTVHVPQPMAGPIWIRPLLPKTLFYFAVPSENFCAIRILVFDALDGRSHGAVGVIINVLGGDDLLRAATAIFAVCLRRRLIEQTLRAQPRHRAGMVAAGFVSDQIEHATA